MKNEQRRMRHFLDHVADASKLPTPSERWGRLCYLLSISEPEWFEDLEKKHGSALHHNTPAVKP
jgi:hypothetical protein